MPPSAAGGLRALQRSAGNRATRALLRQHATKRRPDVLVTIVPKRSLSPDEFAEEVIAQLKQLSQEEARLSIEEIRARGDAPGTGPHYERGVADDEVGTPIRVRVRVDGMTEEASADAEARKEQLAGLSEAERDAIDVETDLRFWARTGATRGTLLGLGRKDWGNRVLWMRTRDEVVRDANRLDALPSAIRDQLMPGGRRPTPDRFAIALRIAAKFEQFGVQEWALYERKGGAPSDDYAALEAVVDRVRTERQAEKRIVDRVQGTETLWHLVLRFRVAQRMGMKKAQWPRFPGYKPMLDELAARGFADATEYEIACAQYLAHFRERALRLAFFVLDVSRRTVLAEKARYDDPNVAAALFARQAVLRGHLRDRSAVLQAPNLSGTAAEEADQLKEAAELLRLADAERAGMAADHPILLDPKLHTTKLKVDDPGELAAVLQSDADDRLEHIGKTETRLRSEWDAVFQLNRIVEVTLQELGGGPDSIGALIVNAKKAQIDEDKDFKSMAFAVVAIGLGLLTFGGGTVALLGVGGSLVVGGLQVHDEWEKYEAAMAAAHTAFDPAQSVSSTEPTVAWVALALLGVGLESAALVATLKAAGPALRLLEAGDVAGFEARLAKAATASSAVSDAIDKAGLAKRDFDAAAVAFKRAWWAAASRPLGVIVPIVDPAVLVQVSRLAFHAARIGIRKFDVFLAQLRRNRAYEQAMGLDRLTREQVEALEGAFKAGVADFDAGAAAARGRLAFDVPYKSGPAKLTFDEHGGLLLDGKPLRPGSTKRDEVLGKLGLSHANRGHGAARDARTIANEATLNAARNPTGDGMSAIFASDAAMAQGLLDARAAMKEVVAGRMKQVISGGKLLVDVPALPNTGRVFVANTHLPAGVTPVNPAPFAGLPVTELPVTHVRALFERRGTAWEIFDLFPLFKR